MFSLSSMIPDISYEIDDKDYLVFFDEQWAHFARVNQGAYLADANILYRSLWDLIADRETHRIYGTMFVEVRRSSETLSFPYRCDTPTQRRFMRMELYPRYNKHIRLISRELQVEERAYVPLLDASAKRSKDFLTICSWCKRVKLSNGMWSEVEEAVESLSLLNCALLPQLIHDICPGCRLFLRC